MVWNIMALYGVALVLWIFENWERKSRSLASARIRRGIVTAPPNAELIIVTKTPMANSFAVSGLNIWPATYRKGTSAPANSRQGTAPRLTMFTRITATAVMRVPIMRDLGMTFSGLFVSSDKNVADSQPKKLSAMKNTATKMAPVPNSKNGWKFAGSMWPKPGIKNARMTTKETVASMTSVAALASEPMNAM